MASIIQKTISPALLRISPSWCRGDHSEEVRTAVALAEDLLDRRCLTEPVDLDEEASVRSEIQQHLGEPTYVWPVVKVSRDGHERCLNEVSPWFATRALHPRRNILCYMVEERVLSPERLKLIEFRFRELDAALLPNDHKNRKHCADRLIHRLNDDHELCRLIEVYWLDRDPGGLSAAEKSGLTNGYISRTKFTPSFRRSRAVSPDVDIGGN